MKFKRKVLAGVAAAGLVAGVAGPVKADTIENNVPEVTANVRVGTIVSGGSLVVTYQIAHPDDAEGEVGCDALVNGTGSEPVTLTVDPLPTGVTSDKTSVAWSTNAECESATKTITFSSSTPGSYTITHDADYTLRNGAGRSMDEAVNFTLNVRPRPATNLSADGGVRLVDLDWDPSADTGIDGYHVYQAGIATPVATTTNTEASITSLQDDTEYCFTVKAYKGDLESDATAEACDSTDAAASTTTYSAAFEQPLDGNGVLNKAKVGRVVPVKVNIIATTNGTPSEISEGAAITLRNTLATCTPGAQADTVEIYAAGASNTSNQFRYDSDGGFWIYNLDTGKLTGAAAGKCYTLQVQRDGVDVPGAVVAISLTK